MTCSPSHCCLLNSLATCQSKLGPTNRIFFQHLNHMTFLWVWQVQAGKLRPSPINPWLDPSWSTVLVFGIPYLEGHFKAGGSAEKSSTVCYWRLWTRKQCDEYVRWPQMAAPAAEEKAYNHWGYHHYFISWIKLTYTANLFLISC